MADAGPQLIDLTRDLSRRVGALRFEPPTTHVYNPLEYAWAPVEQYLTRFARTRPRALMLGMNPGPYGMAQTGVPFGEVAAVRDWLGIEAEVGRPPVEHPKRPIQGFDCPRSEVSGRRFWGWAAERFAGPDEFFSRFFVWNYCPLVFMEEGGKNRTPDKLAAAERDGLYEICDASLAAVVDALQPERIIGIGKFAQSRAGLALPGRDLPIDTVLHPSPASPIANRGWAPQAEKQLEALGVLD
ncbi:MAG: single-stranded DNA-binding protein [Planctomycetota bacterium]|jgi:single-strand selective monofunctional uracil DNA glycosylase